MFSLFLQRNLRKLNNKIMRCQKCKIQMESGKAIKNTIYSTYEGTCIRTGKPIMVEVHKCPQCGYSVEK